MTPQLTREYCNWRFAQVELAALGKVNGHKHLTLLERRILNSRHRVVDCLGSGTPVAQNLHDLLIGAAMGKHDGRSAGCRRRWYRQNSRR